MYAFDPQFVFTALSIFFTVIGATWVVRKAISDSQAQMTKAFGELRAETNKSIGESQARTEESIGELKAETAKSIGESQARTEKSIGELKAETAKSFGESQAKTEKAIGEFKAETNKSLGEIRGDVQALGTRMDCSDKHMDKRMDSLEGQMRDMRGEVRGINEFLRRQPVKDIENDRES